MPETVTARAIVGVYLRRWWIELLMKALKGVVGMGQHQVTKHVDRVERSVAMASMASLLLLTLHTKDIPTDHPWRAFRLPRAFAWEVIQGRLSVRHATSLASGSIGAKPRDDMELPVTFESVKNKL
jgi:hypothetical protein